MDAALVRIILGAIADNNPSQIETGEPEAVVEWLKQRIHVLRPDRGGGTVYTPKIEAAARAAEQAVSRFQRGDAEGAKLYALEALKQLGG